VSLAHYFTHEPLADGIVVDGAVLPTFAIGVSVGTMSTMNISLPETLKAFVDDQVTRRGGFIRFRLPPQQLPRLTLEHLAEFGQ
jgi:hypothetical protein